MARNLKSLTHLTLDQTGMKDLGFIYASKHLPNLQSFCLEGCKITDKGFWESAPYLGNLEELRLGSKHLTDEGFGKATKYLKGLTDLTIWASIKITEKTIDIVLLNLPCLTHLGIENCFQISEQTIEEYRERYSAGISYF